MNPIEINPDGTILIKDFTSIPWGKVFRQMKSKGYNWTSAADAERGMKNVQQRMGHLDGDHAKIIKKVLNLNPIQEQKPIEQPKAKPDTSNIINLNQDGSITIIDWNKIDWNKVYQYMSELGYNWHDAQDSKRAMQRVHSMNNAVTEDHAEAIKFALGINEPHVIKPITPAIQNKLNSFGYTYNVNEAGYIMPDGRMLDFSDKKEGGFPGRRNRDHREVQSIVGTGGRRGMHEIMLLGAIRLLPESGQADLYFMPTPQQIRVLQRIWKDNNTLDLHLWNNVTWDETREFPRGRQKPISNIRHFGSIMKEVAEFYGQKLAYFINKICKFAQNQQTNQFTEYDPIYDSYDALEDVIYHNSNNLINFLKTYKQIYQPQAVYFGENNDILIIKLFINNEMYVIDDGSLSKANDWLFDLDDYRLEEFYPQDFNKDFWEGMGNNYILYHATNPDNIESIKQHGLNASSETRGLSNQGMGAAVFTHPNPDSIAIYGAAIIAINVSAMKKDGYMPTVSGETPLQVEELRNAAAHRLGIEDWVGNEFSSDGLDPETIAFYGNIPPKYLTFIS